MYIGQPVNGDPLTLTEGWATGCSVYEATSEATVVCFSGGNLSEVAADLRHRFPDSPVRIAADLDEHGKGLEYAERAAVAAFPARVVLPAFDDGRVSGDFNDLAKTYGGDAVRNQMVAEQQGIDHVTVPFAEPALATADARDGTRQSRPLTEMGNALRLLDAFGERLRYINDAQAWIIWRDGAWKWDDGAHVRALATGLAAAIYVEGNAQLESSHHFGKWARKSQQRQTIKNAVSLLSDLPRLRIPCANLDAEPMIVGFDHGRQVVDLRVGAIRAAKHSDYITKSLGISTLGDASKAVLWTQFLKQVFGDDRELIDWIQRFCGYLLAGSTQEQLFLFCYGKGADGKSVFIELLAYVMGDYARALASEALAESKRQAGGATPDLAVLIGARFVMTSETEDGRPLAESLVKSLVSGDRIAVRQLFCAPVQFSPKFKLVMCGNHKPIVHGTDDGIWRRVRLVPFSRTFAPAERDPHLLDQLKAEGPDILAWMVQGCQVWRQRGLNDTPSAVYQATAEYQRDQDVVGRWLEECTVPDVNAETMKTDLYANYSAWCVRNGLRSISAMALSRRLSECGLQERKSHGTRLWVNISLAPD